VNMGPLGSGCSHGGCETETEWVASHSLCARAAVSSEALFAIDWQKRAASVQAAIIAADASQIGTNRAKRALRELQAYTSAASAMQSLDSIMERTPCGAAPLRAAITRVEEASATLTAAANPVLPPSAALFAPKLSAAKARIEVEKAAESLAREAKAAKGVEHLPKLEAAILTAKRVKLSLWMPSHMPWRPRHVSGWLTLPRYSVIRTCMFSGFLF
jgi:hypothetical protein